ncbi:Uroporphyrinogen decarboxylase 1 [Arachis hypogaea]|nr:Uroporphyrinogen decarboxylase 1 [Arachis hypogaea]
MIFVVILSSNPLLVKAARGELVSRPPACMMRQVGRYMAVYRKLAEKYPSFRERSETTNLIVEISLQPWNAFRPDGVIIFSNILTPLPAFGVEFDVEDVRGLVIQSPIRSEKGLKALHPIDLEKLSFVGDSLKILRKEVGGDAVILAPHLLRTLLSHLAQAIADYVIFQVESGAHCIQIFDSWGGQLPPDMWERWSKPYIKECAKGQWSYSDASENQQMINRAVTVHMDLFSFERMIQLAMEGACFKPTITMGSTLTHIRFITWTTQCTCWSAARSCEKSVGSRFRAPSFWRHCWGLFEFGQLTVHLVAQIRSLLIPINLAVVCNALLKLGWPLAMSNLLDRSFHIKLGWLLSHV